MPISPEQFLIMQMRLEGNKHRQAIVQGEPEALESDLQDKILADCHGRGWWTLWSRMDLATTTPVGTPDLIVFCDKGRVLIVEAKARNEKLRPAQLGVKLKLEALGHTVHVVRTLQEWLDAVESIKSCALIPP